MLNFTGVQKGAIVLFLELLAVNFRFILVMMLSLSVYSVLQRSLAYWSDLDQLNVIGRIMTKFFRCGPKPYFDPELHFCVPKKYSFIFEAFS